MEHPVSKKFLTDAILQSAEMLASSASRLAGDIVAAIKAEREHANSWGEVRLPLP